MNKMKVRNGQHMQEEMRSKAASKRDVLKSRSNPKVDGIVPVMMLLVTLIPTGVDEKHAKEELDSYRVPDNHW